MTSAQRSECSGPGRSAVAIRDSGCRGEDSNPRYRLERSGAKVPYGADLRQYHRHDHRKGAETPPAHRSSRHVWFHATTPRRLITRSGSAVFAAVAPTNLRFILLRRRCLWLGLTSLGRSPIHPCWRGSTTASCALSGISVPRRTGSPDTYGCPPDIRGSALPTTPSPSTCTEALPISSTPTKRAGLDSTPCASTNPAYARTSWRPGLWRRPSRC
jgi:hypothetical protein